ncbi:MULTISPECIES: hypothetical protein [unclassified Bacillus (in: firmicutes)]|uniref:hypothetical protein n=1 Tax=unclassified Bacillus (in: firmicutes) TaxID=185979 RepID=UPI0011143E0A|nr:MULTISPECIES: hypothetical protein [unclassified Bacillus (in: firmicutes)]
MKTILKATLISLLVLTACSNEASLPTKEEPKKKSEENILITDDGRITFKVFNTVKAPKSTVDSIKKGTLNRL